MIDIYGLVNN